MDDLPEERPDIRPALLPLEWIFEALAAAALLLTLLFFAKLFPPLPATVPTHFDFSGKADGWGSKNTEFLILGIDVGLYALITIVCRFPRAFNMPVTITRENAAREYRLGRISLEAAKLVITTGMLFVIWSTLSGAAGRTNSLGLWFLPVFLCALAAAVGVPMALAYRWR